MKKLIFALALTLCTLALNAQWTSHRNQVGIWNTYTKTYDWGDLNYAKIPIDFQKTRIVLENKSNSVYRIIESLGEETKYNNQGLKIETHSWMAIDNDGKRCRVSMIFMDDPEYDPLVFNVMYDDAVLRFYCKRTGVDRLMN